MSPTRPAAIVVLAAGEGTRMRSRTPKVLHEVGGRLLLDHVLVAAQALDPHELLVVVGHGRDAVVAHLAATAPSVRTVVQEQQRGTGHATRVALDALDALVTLPPDGVLVLVYGDTPLLSATTLAALVDAHVETAAAATVLTARLADPMGYGRVLRGADGSVEAVVEERDATDEQRAVTEVNSGMYAFEVAALRSALARLTAANSQGEEYLTDVLAILRSDGRPVRAEVVSDPDEILGVNDRVQLAHAGRLLRDRAIEGWMRHGVTVVDPATTWVGPDVTLEPDAVLLPHTQLHGRCHVAAGAQVGPGSTLRDTTVAAGARVTASWCEGAEIGPGATVGPYSFLRPGSRLAAGAKVGAYVEMKNATLGEGAKAPHLSYVGDADIGAGANIGAATIFVNYDGVEKHRTVVGEQARVGSDTMLVAPVTVGDGAYTAAGSVITEDVPAGAMGVGRARQRVIEGWVERRRPGSPSAQAAAAARTAEQQAEQQGEQQGEQDEQDAGLGTSGTAAGSAGAEASEELGA